MLPSRTPSAAPRTRFIAALLAACALPLAACADTDDDTTGPSGSAEVTVMTRNIYLGADIFRIARVQSFQQVPVVAGQMFATVAQTNFPERAKALAAEIERANPALVGLQEVTTYRVQQTSDFFSNPLPNAATVRYDFLQLLLAELQARGLSYRVAAKIQNADQELPALLDAANPAALSDIRLTDYDVILARGDVQTAAPLALNYGVSQMLSAGGAPVVFQRGWAKVDAVVDGARFTFINTHLEGNMPAHEAQAQELWLAQRAFAGPVILVGDFNSQANPTEQNTPGFGILTAKAGFTDAWGEVHQEQGMTCCFNETLTSTDLALLDERIDLVLFRGNLEVLSAEVVGDELADRTPGGLWPADHAGVVVTFRVPR